MAHPLRLVLVLLGATSAVAAEAPRGPSFVNDVVPILTSNGCNRGACHGKPGGVNGFSLTLFGHDAAADYNAIVKDVDGRRVNRLDAEASLLLRKPTGNVAHGGGVVLARGSDDYRTLQGWIAAGAPPAQPDEPTLTDITLEPGSESLARKVKQQLTVTARYSDGSRRAVTRLALYEAADPRLATVTRGGLVESGDNAGDAAILVKYGGRVRVYRALIPFGPPLIDLPSFKPAGYIDRHLAEKWKLLGVQPSPECAEVTFLRRASLDLIGTLPTPDEVKTYLADRHADKRTRLVQKLLQRPEFADFWTLQWADLLRINSALIEKEGVAVFYAWLHDAVQKNRPWDELTRELLTVKDAGNFQNGPVNFLRSCTDAEEMAVSTAQAFLGARIVCARCHHHPHEGWKQDDYWQFANFFARVRTKKAGSALTKTKEVVLYLDKNSELVHPRTGQPPLPLKAFGGPLFPDAADAADRREVLAKWLTSPDNDVFARAFVNRVWRHFFGRGLVEPVDDLRPTNPAVNEPLLDALVRDFIAHHYDVKYLIETIATTRAYSLSSQPTDDNRGDQTNFAYAYPRRLTAEQLLDAIAQATAVPDSFPGYPDVKRAIALPDSQAASRFLEVFGKPARTAACSCERRDEPTLSQALLMIGGEALHKKIGSDQGRLTKLLAEKKTTAEIADELCLWTLSRPAKPEEIALAEKNLKQATDARAAWEDFFWVLLNAKEFLLNH